MGLNRPATVLLVAVFLSLLAAPAALAAGTRSLTLRVYSDGYVSVTQVVPADPKATTVQVPLLSNAVSNLVATDQNGSPLSYGFSPGGTNITVYTVGATLVTLRYNTNSLTGKNGTVWTLSYSALYNSTVILPLNSTMISVSGTPYTINETDQYPEATLSPGAWEIEYGVPFATSTTTTATGTQGGPGSSSATTTATTGTGAGAGTTTATTAASTATGGGPGSPPSLSPAEVLGVVVLAVVAGGLSFLWWRGRGASAGADLRPDDVQVLNFIREKGGKVLEFEIRTRFALPKTSAWRQIKRLERLGYIRVTKIGSQNQVEILKEREGDA